ncbi:hypothetical protein EVAR_92758_1 [Eumeta japonica]|uniref:CCHC-type domain-containing protein n=1 Tax=Eumeta variegata TaxID=151549 RepID=A0A4C1T0R6_EUMVA|nr:hypothetical protein EVAR_92758_1 [Eumeta japonica]
MWRKGKRKKIVLLKAQLSRRQREQGTSLRNGKVEKEYEEGAKKQPPEKPLVPIPKPKQRKPRRSAMRPEALIIRPTDKEKYSEILRRIKTAVPSEQVCNTVEKMRRTAAGDMLITMSKGSGDRKKTLHNIIVLQEDAKVINTGPEEDLEIRDLDDTTTTGDILATLQTAAGNDCGITAEAIKIRKAFRGTQTASVTLAAAKAQKVVGEHGKIRIGWVNCRIRIVIRLVRCFKCWHFGHRAVQCKSEWTEPNSALSMEKRDTRLPSAISQQNRQFVAASVDGICFYSCYAPPSLSIAEFTDFLDKLTQQRREEALLSGDRRRLQLLGGGLGQ